MMNSIRKLSNEQIESFDVEYIPDSWWQEISKTLRRIVPREDFNFLDIGGGNGLFADRILCDFPESKGVILDNSSLILNKNRINERKKLICDSVENLETIFREEKFDIIFANWVLHHLIYQNYLETRKFIVKTLTVVKKLLSPSGRISIIENMYDGILINNLPSHLIFALTSSKTIAPLVKVLGANTAGCGVCFLSKKQWEYSISKSGLKIDTYTDGTIWKFPLLQKVFLHLGSIRVGQFWCS
jgi:ubiquinone/menaquinone biosynthesis C-methylase UbiE